MYQIFQWSFQIKRLANREVALLSMNVRNKCLQERTEELKAENRDLTKTMVNVNFLSYCFQKEALEIKFLIQK